MKKTILIAAIFSIFTFCVNAQDRDQPHFGIKGGVNYSNVYDIKGQDFSADFKLGFAGGLFVAIPLGELFGIQPEILYSQKGYISKGSILGSSYKITHTSDYIDIPILLQIKPSDYITIVAGPQYSYLVSTKNKFENSILNIQDQKDFDNTNIRKNILAVVGGLDFNIEHVVIGTRVGYDIMNNNGDGTSTSPRYRNLWIQATLGFKF